MQSITEQQSTSQQALPLLQLEQRGRAAEIIIDTGHPLRDGRTWRAFAYVNCGNVFNARLTVESLRRRIGEAVASARKAAYNAGYRDALRGQAPTRHFSGDL